MLVEALSNLAHRAGAERISLEISPSDRGECSVLIVTSFGHSVQTTEHKKEGAILSALAAPLVIKGNVGELDSRLVNLIDDIEDDYAAASKELPETDAQKRKREIKEAVEKKNKKTTTKKVTRKTGSTKSEPEGKPEEKKGSEDSENDHAESLADGTADTL